MDDGFLDLEWSRPNTEKRILDLAGADDAEDFLEDFAWRFSGDLRETALAETFFIARFFMPDFATPATSFRR